MKSHILIKNPKISSKCVFVLLILLFCYTMTTFIVNEFGSLSKSNSTVLRILLSPIASTENAAQSSELNSSKFLLINVERNKQDAIDRVARQVFNKTENSQKVYYEEQQPVVVHAESRLPIMDFRKNDNAAQQQQDTFDQTEDERPYYTYDNDEDYFNPGKSSGYEQNGRPLDYEDYSEGRSTQNQQYDSRQWNYNPWSFASRNSAQNTQSVKEPTKPDSDTNSAYPSYSHEMVEYDYPMGFVHRQQSNAPKMSYNPDVKTQKTQQSYPRIPNRKQQQQLQQQQINKQPQQAPTVAPMQSNESTLLSVAKGLKTMWDIYQAFSTAWNTIAEHRQRQDDALKEKLKKQQQQQRTRIRINSKKPPKFSNNTTVINDNGVNNDKSIGNGNGNSTTKIRSTKSPKLKSTTTKLPVLSTSTTLKTTTAKVEQRRGTKGDRALKLDAFGIRERRDSDAGTDMSSVGEGRYIKGDPLKGYYDFVITEGSYKFWAIFQTGTAILIIYSVFAAIYYSKVNPLVSDYDYTDYLGGARSLSGGDLDFVDDEDDHTKKSSASWYDDLLPKAGHSVKFILDAIDKFPVDHEADFKIEKDVNSMEYTTSSSYL